MGEHNRRLAEQWSWNRVAEMTLKVYKVFEPLKINLRQALANFQLGWDNCFFALASIFFERIVLHTPKILH